MALQRSLRPLAALIGPRWHAVPNVACRALSSAPADEQQQQQQQQSSASASAQADQQAAAPAAGQSSMQQRQKAAAEEEWTEVIDEKSGQPYYWNQKTGAARACLALHAQWRQRGLLDAAGRRTARTRTTRGPPCTALLLPAARLQAGETTELGEPRPKSRFRDRQYEEAAAQGSGPFQEGWRCVAWGASVCSRQARGAQRTSRARRPWPAPHDTWCRRRRCPLRVRACLPACLRLSVRREPPGRDFTYVYSVIGVVVGVGVGWFTQYLH
jgi:hypothetical protein